ncbi:phosphotransferase [Nocardia rhamnosiphila]|uniref:Phosphotransferase n=1 Tax=Nocardia rhamnosiphila TaxID=426716 RepID=A0ABV2WQG0_9NOCA
MTDSSDGRAGIDVRLVEQLIATRFPQWSRLPVTPVAHDGHDNRTYRLGEELTVRLPTAAPYASGITKKSRWLPALGPALPLRIPVVPADGAPGSGYPFPWSVRRWIPGDTWKTLLTLAHDPVDQRARALIDDILAEET